MDVEFDSILFSIIIAFISFFFWSRIGSQILAFINGFFRQTTTPTTTINNNNNINNDNIDLSNNNNTINNNSNNNVSQSTTTTQYPPEPYQETFSSDDNDLTKIKIIQSETIFHRTFRTSKILNVYDLKKYFYPREIQDNKRILFIYNGRPMTDSHLLTEYPNLLNGINGIGCIHCLIKEQLTADQVDNGTSGNGNNHGYSSNNNNNNNNNNSNNHHSNNHNVGDGSGTRRNVYNPHNGAYNNDFFTWMCTRTLFILTGLFLTLLWCLQFLTPKLFNNFSSFMLLIFTLFWSLCFYSSFKPHANFQQPQPQNSATMNHPHN